MNQESTRAPILRIHTHTQYIFRLVLPVRIELLTNCGPGSLIHREQTCCGLGVTGMCHVLWLCYTVALFKPFFCSAFSLLLFVSGLLFINQSKFVRTAIRRLKE